MLCAETSPLQPESECSMEGQSPKVVTINHFVFELKNENVQL